MKILITGADGQLGKCLRQRWEEKHRVFAFGRKSLDITLPDQLADCLKQIGPDYIINCAAYNKVDLAQDCETEAFAVNDRGVRNLADLASAQTKILHLSTDYVFDGRKRTPYIESDEALPLSVYGRSKKAGEDHLLARRKNAVVVRTAWLYSVGSGNFCRTIVDKLRQGTPLRVVSDQIGSPTSVEDLSRQLELLIREGADGLFHASAQGSCSWYDYAEHIRRQMGIGVSITAITTAQLQAENPGIKAPRPAYSVLENARLQQLGIDIMSPWAEELTGNLRAIL